MHNPVTKETLLTLKAQNIFGEWKASAPLPFRSWVKHGVSIEGHTQIVFRVQSEPTWVVSQGLDGDGFQLCATPTGPPQQKRWFLVKAPRNCGIYPVSCNRKGPPDIRLFWRSKINCRTVFGGPISVMSSKHRSLQPLSKAHVPSW